MDDTGRIIQRMNALHESSPDAESILMDGYARALELEGERTRLERRFASLAQALADDHDPGRLPELRSLKERISRTEAELKSLREVLQAVRRRLVAAGVAVPA
jgi:DNA-binding SARP family transcriptional activator